MKLFVRADTKMPEKIVSQAQSLLEKIDLKKMPRHVAIIMDGNGRWAKQRGLPRILGHKAGTESVRETVRTCGKLKIEALTLFAFSTENWSRSAQEVSGLMTILSSTLKKEVPELDQNNVRLKTIGRIHQLPKNVQRELETSIAKLAKNTGLILTLALNYGGRQEIVDAVNEIVRQGIKTVDENEFSQFLYTQGMTDPDLLIRTSGEQRISNFLLYQCAYAEFYSTPTLWPDFRAEHLYEAILDFQKRERRYGGT